MKLKNKLDTDPNDVLRSVGIEPPNNPLAKALLASRLDDAVNYVLERYKTPGQLPGRSTGFPSLDDVIDGLQDGHFLVLGARSGMGKTIWATNVALNVAEHCPTGFLSLEQPAHELALRILADKSGISLRDLKRGEFEEAEIRAALKLLDEIKQRQFYLHDTFDRDYRKIHDEAAKLIDLGVQALFVDYLQLARGADTRNRHLEIGEISRNFKEIATEFNVPVIALSQLNRETERNIDKRPTLSNLRESGSIEQDADVVMFLHREYYYFLQEPEPDPTSDKYEDWLERRNQCKGKAELIIAKNRHGPTGNISLEFDERRLRFSDLGGVE